MTAMIWHNATQTDQETETKEKTLLAPTWNVIVHDDRYYMFYNGNGFGRTGIGYAVAERSS